MEEEEGEERGEKVGRASFAFASEYSGQEKKKGKRGVSIYPRGSDSGISKGGRGRFSAGIGSNMTIDRVDRYGDKNKVNKREEKGEEEVEVLRGKGNGKGKGRKEEGEVVRESRIDQDSVSPASTGSPLLLGPQRSYFDLDDSAIDIYRGRRGGVGGGGGGGGGRGTVGASEIDNYAFDEHSSGADYDDIEEYNSDGIGEGDGGRVTDSDREGEGEGDVGVYSPDIYFADGGGPEDMAGEYGLVDMAPAISPSTSPSIDESQWGASSYSNSGMTSNSTTINNNNYNNYNNSNNNYNTSSSSSIVGVSTYPSSIESNIGRSSAVPRSTSSSRLDNNDSHSSIYDNNNTSNNNSSSNINNNSYQSNDGISSNYNSININSNNNSNNSHNNNGNSSSNDVSTSRVSSKKPSSQPFDFDSLFTMPTKKADEIFRSLGISLSINSPPARSRGQREVDVVGEERVESRRSNVTGNGYSNSSSGSSGNVDNIDQRFYTIQTGSGSLTQASSELNPPSRPAATTSATASSSASTSASYSNPIYPAAAQDTVYNQARLSRPITTTTAPSSSNNIYSSSNISNRHTAPTTTSSSTTSTTTAVAGIGMGMGAGSRGGYVDDADMADAFELPP